MTASVASMNNTYVPSFDATGHLVVAFSRNPKDFPLNKWAKITPVKKSIGYFLQVTAEQAARITDSTYLADFVWPDGNDAPSGIWGLEAFNFKEYSTTRFAFPFRLGYKANEQADWKILATHSAFVAQQAMTGRAVRMINAATNASNYPAANVNSAKTWQGQITLAANEAFLTAGSTANPAIKNTLNAMAQQIILGVNGAVKRNALVVIMNPNSAAQLGASAELQNTIIQSPFALAQVRGDVENQNGLWGLPDTLYGYKLIVDDTVYVPTKKGASAQTHSFAFPDNQFLMGTRVGGLDSPAGGPSFSTWHMFMYEEMTVEQRDDPDHRRTTARVVEDYDVQVVAPVTGAVCTNMFS